MLQGPVIVDPFSTSVTCITLSTSHSSPDGDHVVSHDHVLFTCVHEVMVSCTMFCYNSLTCMHENELLYHHSIIIIIIIITIMYII